MTYNYRTHHQFSTNHKTLQIKNPNFTLPIKQHTEFSKHCIQSSPIIPKPQPKRLKKTKKTKKKIHKQQRSPSPGGVRIGERVVPGMVTEIINRDTILHQIRKPEPPLHDRGPGGDIGAVGLRRRVLGEEVEAADERLGLGGREAG